MTSTALAAREIHPAAPVEWDRELRGANYLLASGLCPDALKTPEAVLFVVLAGRDLGLSPVASLRGLTIIKGKLEVSADLQLGLFHAAGGRSQWEELSDTRAALKLAAPWLTAPHLSVFTMADATRAGLAQENYRKYPKAMLRSRAITQGLKDIGFDATAGVYAPGEIGGEAVVVADEVQPPAAAAPAETGEVPTEAQQSLLLKALRSDVWTDEERDDWTERSRGLTKIQMAGLLDQVLEAGRQKKAARIKLAVAT